MASYDKQHITDRLYFDETPFEKLMQNRIIEILLVCSNYDRFILEEDGRIDEQIFQEYVSLGLHYPPRFSFASSEEEAFRLLGSKRFDLIITMLYVGESHAYELGRRIKRRVPDKPIVVLTRSSRDVSMEIEKHGTPHTQHVFNWLGNADILLAVVKLIEDSMNVEHDLGKVGVQTIILVEDSVRYYSRYLPIVYRVLFEQARALMREGLNEHQQNMRMRGRPKILLATNFEDALDLYQRYRSNLLGVISDISYRRRGEADPLAGLALCRHIRVRDPELPILLQSSRREHEEDAQAFNASFIFKQSKALLNDLRTYIKSNYGFGDFVFVMPDTYQEIGHAADLAEFQRKLQTVPAASIDYHARNHHISKWLKARALYTLANIIRPKRFEDFDGIESVREYLVDTIKNYRLHMGRGTIATFDRDKFDDYSVFQRIGDGSLGGKARGIAFINTVLKRNRIMFRFDGVVVQIPKSVVLTTDVFERFMEDNDLHDIALSDRGDEEILTHFLRARLPVDIVEDLAALARVFKKPLAVRSSSLLEDSSQQPFAGVYMTYFIPNNSPHVDVRVRELGDAIKGVYASVYYRDSKSYASATQHRVDEEMMAVIVQEVTGTTYDDVYYPNISGVARSLNFYPLEHERTGEGVVNVALGMGKTVVDGQVSLRFSPRYPRKILQLSSTDLALRSTQKMFYAIDLAEGSFRATTDESFNLLHRDIEEAARHRVNRQMVSTYDHQGHAVRDDPMFPGRKLVTFAPVLKYETFPLAEITRSLLELGSQEMNMPVEMEFAVNLDVPEGEPRSFKVLQLRPIVEEQISEEVRVDGVATEEAIITARTALGNGLYRGLHDIVYVKPDAFEPSRTEAIIQELDALNRCLQDEERNYILVGPGRWGTADPWLGVPVQWANISGARVIVEASLGDFRVDASQGSHFFQNLTMFHVAYLSVDPSAGDGTYDVEYLDAVPACHEDAFLRHLRFDSPIVVRIDGRQSGDSVKAVVLKPDDGPYV